MYAFRVLVLKKKCFVVAVVVFAVVEVDNVQCLQVVIFTGYSAV